jgi:hypothetical protein
MATVKLHRIQNNTGGAERSSSIHFHGMNYPIHFDRNGFVDVDEDDWVDWIADSAAKLGIQLVPAPPKQPAPKKAAAKPAAKPAAKRKLLGKKKKT